jgi:hypothetical protein
MEGASTEMHANTLTISLRRTRRVSTTTFQESKSSLLTAFADSNIARARRDSASEASYRRWTMVLRNCFGSPDRERLWEGALAILDGDDRELRQKVAQDLSNVGGRNESGLQQIKSLVEERAQPGQLTTLFIHARRYFLMVMTHPTFLDSLSLDTHVSTLYVTPQYKMRQNFETWEGLARGISRARRL